MLSGIAGLKCKLVKNASQCLLSLFIRAEISVKHPDRTGGGARWSAGEGGRGGGRAAECGGVSRRRGARVPFVSSSSFLLARSKPFLGRSWAGPLCSFDEPLPTLLSPIAPDHGIIIIRKVLSPSPQLSPNLV
jgi:hypothetical protein